jgi:hypothetical protein
LRIRIVLSNRLFVLLICFAVTLVGCGKAGPKTGKLSGTVTLDGTALESGSINFIPTDGKGVTMGTKIVNGAYTLAVPYGEKKVEVRAPKVTGQRLAYEGDPNSPKVDIITELVPKRYNGESVLVMTVDSEEGEMNFPLETPKDAEKPKE